MNRWTKVALAGVLLGAVATAWPKGKLIDIDGDGYKEARVFYSDGQITKTLVDTDHDGRMETTIYYKDGHREHAEQDLDRDGITNRWISYYFTGIAWKVAEDHNGDGKPDYWFYLKDGQIYKWEQDRNGDGVADIKTTYEKDAAGRERALTQQSYDNDFDGEFETLSGITAVRKEATLPHSLAEALLR